MGRSVNDVDVSRRLNEAQAQKLIRRIISTDDEIAFSGHALEQMRDRGLIENDVLNVLRCGLVVDPPDEKNGSWRYKVETD